MSGSILLANSVVKSSVYQRFCGETAYIVLNEGTTSGKSQED